MLKSLIIFILSFAILNGCESPLLNQQALSSYIKEVRPNLWSSNLELGLEVEWVDGPFGNPSQESKLRFIFKDQLGQDQKLPDGLYVNHYGWMPHMGHGTADDGVLTPYGDYGFETSDLYFNMPGYWEIHFLFCRNSSCSPSSEIVDEVIFSFHI